MTVGNPFASLRVDPTGGNGGYEEERDPWGKALALFFVWFVIVFGIVLAVYFLSLGLI